MLTIAAIGAGFAAGGFVRFSNSVAALTTADAPTADAIVVLTGGADRIAEAMTLLVDGRAERLLVSGVHAGTPIEAITEPLGVDAELVACCIDFDRDALDTRGNADATAAWVAEFGFDSLIVVTSAYHMPRSLAELERLMPEVTLIPSAVPLPSDRAWFLDPGSMRLLMEEYLKYVAVRASHIVDKPAASDTGRLVGAGGPTTG
jgi:uncharacterized SAM-binding protein YcdF (DUF218 family)